MKTEKKSQYNENEQGAESTDTISNDTSHGSQNMYDTNRKQAAKLIGLERSNYAFVLLMLLVGVIGGMFLLGVSYRVAAIVGGLGALALIFGMLSAPSKEKPSSDDAHE